MSERFSLNDSTSFIPPTPPANRGGREDHNRQLIRGGRNTQEELDDEAWIILTDHHFKVQFHCATTLRPFKIRSSACTHGSEFRNVRRHCIIAHGMRYRAGKSPQKLYGVELECHLAIARKNCASHRNRHGLQNQQKGASTLTASANTENDVAASTATSNDTQPDFDPNVVTSNFDLPRPAFRRLGSIPRGRRRDNERQGR